MRCERCGAALPPAGGRERSRLVLGVLGTRRSGKTSWVVRAIGALGGEAGGRRLPLPGQEEAWRRCCATLDMGRAMPPTPQVPGAAWCLDRESESGKERVYLYEISGHESSDPELLLRHRCLRHVDGFVVAIDPFSLPQLRKRYGAVVRSMRPPVEPGDEAYGEAHLSAMLHALGMLRKRPKDGRWPLSVAVVVTKADVMGLCRRFSDGGGGLEEGAEDACRRELEQWGFAAMARELSFHFHSVRYFACHPRAEGALSAANPLLWSLASAREEAGRGGAASGGRRRETQRDVAGSESRGNGRTW
jgi:hypothetical protein